MSDWKRDVRVFLAGGLSAVLVGGCVLVFAMVQGSKIYRGTVWPSPDKRVEVSTMVGEGRYAGRGIVHVRMASVPEPILVMSNMDAPDEAFNWMGNARVEWAADGRAFQLTSSDGKSVVSVRLP